MPLTLHEIDSEDRNRMLSSTADMVRALRLRRDSSGGRLSLSRALPLSQCSPGEFLDSGFEALRNSGWCCFVLEADEAVAAIEFTPTVELVRLSRGAPVRRIIVSLRRAERWIGEAAGETELVRVGGIGFTAIRVDKGGGHYFFPISMPPGVHRTFGLRDEREIEAIVRTATARRVEMTKRFAPVGDSELAQSKPPR